VNNGYFDSVEITAIRTYNQNMLEFLRTQKQNVLDALKKGWGDEDKDNLVEAIKAFELTQK